MLDEARPIERVDVVTPTRYTQGGAFTCVACGASYLPAYPLPLGAYRAIARWWVGAHRHCSRLEPRHGFGAQDAVQAADQEGETQC